MHTHVMPSLAERGSCHAVVDAQNKLTQGLFSQCKSRSQFKDLFRQLYDYEKFGCPSKHGSR